MRCFLLNLFVVFGMMTSNSQTVNYQWGPIHNFVNPSDQFTRIVFYGRSGVVMEREDKENNCFYIDKHDASLNLIYSKRIECWGLDSDRDQRYLSTQVLNDKVYVFIKDRDRHLKQCRLLVLELGDTGELKKRFFLGTFSTADITSIPEYMVTSSPDHSKLVAIAVCPSEGGLSEKWHCVIYDEDSKKVLLENDVLDTGLCRTSIDFSELLIDNYGVVYAFNSRRTENNGCLMIGFVTMGLDGKVKKTYTNLMGKPLISHRVFFNKQGQASSVGVFGKSLKYSDEIDGHYYLSVNEKGDKVSCTQESFGEDVFELVNAMNMKNRNEHGLPSLFKFAHCVESDQGEMLLFFEEQKKVVLTLSIFPIKKQKANTNNHLVVVRLNRDGHRLWVSDLKKNQAQQTYSDSVSFGGVVPVVRREDVYFLWNRTFFDLSYSRKKALGVIDSSVMALNIRDFKGAVMFPTCLSGYDKNGELLFKNHPIKYALPLYDMYEGAKSNVSINSGFYGQFGNKVLLPMVGFRADSSSGLYYQLCVVTVL